MRRVAATVTASALAAIAVALYSTIGARSSDHQDAPLLLQRPGADITDVYAFPAKNPNDVAFAIDVHPLIPRGTSSGVSFDPGVLYQLKFDTAGDYHEHVVMQFKAQGAGASQTIAAYGPAPAASSTTSTVLSSQTGSTQLGRTSQLSNGIVFFAGARRDPFYFDLTQFFKIDPDRNAKYHPNVPAPSAACFNDAAHATNTLADFNVLSLVVELPRSLLTTPENHGRINLWATTSVASDTSSGTYTQIERWGRPAVKEALEKFERHAISNAVEPYADPTLKQAIVSYMTTPRPAGAGRSVAIANALASVLVPDEMQVDLSAGGHATYLGVETKGKSGLPVGIVRAVPDAGLNGLKSSLRNGARGFGGRDPDSPVIDLSLGAIYGSIIPKVGLAKDDHHETPCLTSDGTKPAAKAADGFPYLNAPI